MTRVNGWCQGVAYVHDTATNQYGCSDDSPGTGNSSSSRLQLHETRLALVFMVVVNRMNRPVSFTLRGSAVV